MQNCSVLSNTRASMTQYQCGPWHPNCATQGGERCEQTSRTHLLTVENLDVLDDAAVLLENRYSLSQRHSCKNNSISPVRRLAHPTFGRKVTDEAEYHIIGKQCITTHGHAMDRGAPAWLTLSAQTRALEQNGHCLPTSLQHIRKVGLATSQRYDSPEQIPASVSQHSHTHSISSWVHFMVYLSVRPDKWPSSCTRQIKIQHICSSSATTAVGRHFIFSAYSFFSTQQLPTARDGRFDEGKQVKIKILQLRLRGLSKWRAIMLLGLAFIR